MPKRCENFGVSQDLLGKQVQFNFKKGPKYGTVCGGYCSLTARLFIWIVAAIELISCFTDPIYVESTS